MAADIVWLREVSTQDALNCLCYELGSYLKLNKFSHLAWPILETCYSSVCLQPKLN
jgi:hypothetical protein